MKKKFDNEQQTLVEVGPPPMESPVVENPVVGRVPVKKKNDVPMDVSVNSIEINTAEQMLQTARYLMQKKLVPKSFKSEDEVVIAIHACKALGFNDFGSAHMALKEMYIINGGVHIFGQLPLALVHSSGKMAGIEEFFVDDKGRMMCVQFGNLKAPIMAAVCRVKRVGEDQKWVEFVVTKEDLELSGGKFKDNTWFFVKGYTKSGEPYYSETWKKYPKLHWKYRARALALRTLFSDVLKNVTMSGSSSEAKKEGISEKNSSIADKYQTNGENERLNEGNLPAKLDVPNLTKEEK